MENINKITAYKASVTFNPDGSGVITKGSRDADGSIYYRFGGNFPSFEEIMDKWDELLRLNIVSITYHEKNGIEAVSYRPRGKAYVIPFEEI